MVLLTPEDNELEVFEKFKSKVSDLAQDDETCLRFLRARSHDIPKAEDMLRKSVAWRKEKNIAQYLNRKPPPIIEEDFIFGHTGIGHNGNPVFWIPIGNWNARDIVEQGYKEETREFAYYLFENIINVFKKVKASQGIFIVCVKELTMYKIANLDAMKVLFSALQDMERNYPEVINKIYVINAPWAFTIAYNFVKPVLTGTTKSKIHIHGSDMEKWMSALQEVMPKDAIPLQHYTLNHNDHYDE